MAGNRQYPVIDAHNHPDWLGHDLNRFLQNMEQFGIDKTWLLSYEAPETEYPPSSKGVFPNAVIGSSRGPVPFSRCLSYAERAPEKFILGYAPDPREPQAIDSMKAAVEIYGARVCGEVKLRMMYDNPDALRLFKYCGTKGIPVVLHFDYEFECGNNFPRPSYWYGGGIDVLERMLVKCPDTIFLGHAPGFWAHISGDDLFDKEAYPSGPVIPDGKVIELLRKYDNLYCDLSGGSGCNALKRDLNFAQDFLTEFQDRILYARDVFENFHQELLDSLNLPEEIMCKIYGANAERLVDGFIAE